ncbi:MAG: MATE family efflux transporter [bacterium]|nr:MATE family efflux transporter [bacterium]
MVNERAKPEPGPIPEPGKTRAKLIEGPVGKTLVRLTLPMVIGIMAMMAFNLVDTFFVGQLGTIQLAAMSFTFPVVFVIGSIALGLGVGASAVISRAIGEGDNHKVRRITTDALMLSLVIVISFVFAGLLTIEPLFRLLGASPEILPFIKEYMTIWYPGVAFVIIPMVGNSAIRATGDTKTPAMIMMVVVVVNLALDPLLIFGIGPFPRWELQGAAVATVFARAAALVVSLWVLNRREKMLTFVPPTFKEVLSSWKKVLYIGLPAAGTNLIIPVSLGVITRLVATYGTEAVAALGVAVRLEGFSLTVIMALSSVLTPFVGQNWGAKLYHRAALAVKYSRRFAMAWGGGIFILFLFFARPIAGLFNDNPMVISTIATYIWMVAGSYGFLGTLMLTGSTFNGLNKPMPAAALSLLRMAVLYIPLAFLGSYLWQLKGIFGAATVANITTGIAAFYWLNNTIKTHRSKA